MTLIGCLIFFVLLLVVVSAFQVSASAGIVTLLVIIGIFSLFFYIAVQSERKEKLQNEIKKQKLFEILNSSGDFKSSKEFISYDYKNILALDEESKRICVVSDDGTRKIYLYKDLLQVEIVEDGVSVTTTSRTSQLGGALVGGMLAGGVGAVIGGLSGKTKTEREINSIELKLVVNDTNQPVYSFVFYKKKKFEEFQATQKAKNEVNFWHSLISVLIKRADEEDITSNESNKNDYNSVADELLKLSELLKQGIITKEEFEKQKTKLLS